MRKSSANPFKHDNPIHSVLFDTHNSPLLFTPDTSRTLSGLLSDSHSLSDLAAAFVLPLLVAVLVAANSALAL